VTALWEIFLQVIGEAAIEFALGESYRQRSRAHPVIAAVGALLLGALVGFLTSLIWPARLLRPGPLPGASLVVSPLVTGALMDRIGRWRERGGAEPSYMATFWGGALFALSMALVRFVWVGM
jgi:hypothetical protein